MKKQTIIALALLVSAFSFAQKKELKVVEKAMKTGNYSEAKTAIKQAGALISSMDDKTKSKYYLLNGKILYSNGLASSEDLKLALESLNKVDGSLASEAKEFKTTMLSALVEKGNKAYNSEQYAPASSYFENAYRASDTDTIYLNFAALTALQSKEYKRSLNLYKELTNMGYTGISTEYFATNKKTNEEEKYDKNSRDLLVKSGSHINPEDRVSKSKRADIVKNIAIIYLNLDDKEKAIKALRVAREQNPDDVDLVVTEANIYYEMGNEEEFKNLLVKATEMDPDNAQLYYNIGVVNMNKGNLDAAQSSFEKVLSLDPANSDAAISLSNISIEKGNVIIEEMGKLGMSNADNIKYEELKEVKNKLFQGGADILTAFISKNPNSSSDIFTQLKNIYQALGETAKAKEIIAKLATMAGE